MSVQNTYISTFQTLGALGLLLGTFGLAAVQIRSVLERKKELGLMRAIGFQRNTLAKMVVLENAWLLIIGPWHWYLLSPVYNDPPLVGWNRIRSLARIELDV